MYEYKQKEKVLVKSHGYKDGFMAIKIEVFGVPFMCGWRDGECMPTTDSVIDAIINHFGSISADIYTAIKIAYKRAIDEILWSALY